MHCKRTFYFGGDASLECTWTVRLPLCIGGKYGYVQMYLLPGETPMLLGRPIMESLGLVLDCRNRMIKVDDMAWQYAVVGTHGEYLISLLNEFDSSMWQFPPAFELVVPVDGGVAGELMDFQTFNTEVNLFNSQDVVQVAAQDDMRPTRRHLLQTCDTKLTALENELHAYITEELHQPERKRVLWEVDCGGARVSALAEAMQRLRTEMLDEVYLALSYHLWSQMQNLAARTEAQQHQLYLKRKEHHACHLMFVVRVYKEQIDNARHAHIEQPERALSWHTTALKDLPGYWILLHQCMFGAALVWIRTDYGSL